MDISIYKNRLWNLLDDSSQLYILTNIIKNDFKGECRLIAKVVGEGTIMTISDEHGKSLDIPIDILDILNN